MSKTRPIEKDLPVVDWYDKLPAMYKSIVSQQGLALMQREGITDADVEHALGQERSIYIYPAIQSRDLLCQILLEARALLAEAKETKALLQKILKEAQG